MKKVGCIILTVLVVGSIVFGGFIVWKLGQNITDSNGGGTLANREGMGLNVTASPLEGLKVKAEWLDVDVENTGADLGQEINVQLFYDLTEKVKLHAYAAQWDPEVGNNDPTLLGLQLHAKF